MRAQPTDPMERILSEQRAARDAIAEHGGKVDSDPQTPTRDKLWGLWQYLEDWHREEIITREKWSKSKAKGLKLED